MRLTLAVLAAAFVMGSPANAQAPAVGAVATFRVGGIDFKLPLPDGYCLPTDKYIDIAQAVAAMDNENVTDLTAYRCDGQGMSVDYPLLIKTPKSVLLNEVGRKELLSQMGAEFDKPEFANILASGEIDQSSSDSVSAVLGESVAVKSEIKPIGKDETCAYLAGTVALGDKDGSSPIALTACITAVHKRVLLVYAFGPFSGPKSILALAPKAKALALTLIKQNE
jgi:hypothetical protein